MGLTDLFQRDPLAAVVVAMVLLLSLALHESGHAYVADRLGDPTPRSFGRVTLNPLKHLDPIGSLLLLFGPIGFGRPVPVNFGRLGRWRGLAAVAAGPLVNVSIALVAALLLRLVGGNILMAEVLGTVLTINVVLAVFNLLPIPLLDGSRILASLFPRTIGRSLMEFERLPYAFIIVLIFIVIARPIINPLLGTILTWFGIG